MCWTPPSRRSSSTTAWGASACSSCIHHTSAASYTDYSLTLGKDLGNGLALSAALVGTDADKTGYVTPAGKFTGKTALVLGAKFTF